MCDKPAGQPGLTLWSRTDGAAWAQLRCFFATGVSRHVQHNEVEKMTKASHISEEVNSS